MNKHAFMKFSGIILAGGQSKRMQKDKRFLNVGNKTFLDTAYELLEDFCEEIIICGNPPDTPPPGRPFVPDIYPQRGPLGGILTGLMHAKHFASIVMPVDMPLINKEIIKVLLNNFDEKHDIFVFKTEKKLQPLVGIYTRNVMPVIKKRIESGQLKLTDLVRSQKTKIIPAKAYSRAFLNINDPVQYAELLKILSNDR